MTTTIPSRPADVDAVPAGLSEADIVRAALADDARLGRLAALKHLARIRSREVGTVAAAILADPKADRRLRATAAGTVAKALAPRAAQERLLAAIGDPADEVVFRRSVEALGQLGDGQALAALETIAARPGSPAAASLDFARTLLSHRLRDPRRQVALPPASLVVRADPAKARPVKIASAEPSEVELAAFRAAAKGLAVSPRHAVGINCAGRRLRLMLVEPFTTAAEIATLAEKPGVLMAMFAEHLSLETPALIATFLARPGARRGEIAVVGVASHGQPMYTGSLERSADNVRFAFHAVAGVYAAPIEIAGSFDFAGRKLVLTGSLSETRAARGQRRIPRRAGAGPVG